MQRETVHPWIADLISLKQILAWDSDRSELRVTIVNRESSSATQRWLLIIENGEPRLERIEPEAKPEDGAEEVPHGR